MTKDEALNLALDALENHTEIKHPQQIHYRDAAITAIKEALAQPAQEPNACCAECGKKKSDGWFLYCVECVDNTPAQKPWVGLTDEEIEQACVPLGAAALSFTEVARAIESALRSKNT